MKFRYIYTILLVLSVTSQAYSDGLMDRLNGKWAFSGSRTALFMVRNDSLFLAMVTDHSKEYDHFYNGNIDLDSLELYPCVVSEFDNRAMIKVNTEKWYSSISFMYSDSDSSSIYCVGDVYYSDKKVPNANSNCNMEVPYCVIKLHSLSELDSIKKLVPIEEITREDVFSLLKKVEILCAGRCNKCNEGFIGGDFNNLLIDMGYNPIREHVPFNDQFVYDISAFDTILDVYEDDDELLMAIERVVVAFWNNESANTEKD